MKKRLLGSLIALGGSLVAVGTAFALYRGTLPVDKTIQIGTKTSGDVVLNASVANADSEHAMLTPTNYSRSIVFNAGFTNNSGSVYNQPYYLAHLEFKISSASKGMIDALKDHSWVELGTQSGSNAYGAWFGWTWSDDAGLTENLPHTGTRSGTTNRNHLNGKAAVVAADGKSVSWSVNYPLFAGTDVSEFLFHVQMEGIDDDDYLAIAESSYTVNFNVSDVDYTGYEAAYIVGDATGGWEDKDEYRMVPNAKASGFEWMYKTGTAEGVSYLQGGKDFKVHKGSTWCHGDGANHVWDSTNNGKVFYWAGSGEYSLGTL